MPQYVAESNLVEKATDEGVHAVDDGLAQDGLVDTTPRVVVVVSCEGRAHAVVDTV